MKRGILFDKIEEADTDHKGHLRADVFVDASPFHDDKNDDRSDDGDPLFERFAARCRHGRPTRLDPST